MTILSVRNTVGLAMPRPEFGELQIHCVSVTVNLLSEVDGEQKHA